jgi:hypothetical protein
MSKNSISGLFTIQLEAAPETLCFSPRLFFYHTTDSVKTKLFLASAIEKKIEFGSLSTLVSLKGS